MALGWAALGAIAGAVAGGAQAVAAAPALLAPGAPAPTFSATAHDGSTVDLAKLRGRPVVLYFYPMDDTPGCTKEAWSFRDAWARYSKAGVTVIGVSTDDNKSHRSFAEKHQLPFRLVPDSDGRIAGLYGVPVTNGHASRITYLIDAKGKVAKVWPQVNPEGHADEILAAAAAR